jgi:hypothetical protein
MLVLNTQSASRSPCRQRPAHLEMDQDKIILSKQDPGQSSSAETKMKGRKRMFPALHLCLRHVTPGADQDSPPFVAAMRRDQ